MFGLLGHGSSFFACSPPLHFSMCSLLQLLRASTGNDISDILDCKVGKNHLQL